ncbi:unnamed protein product [Urochloa humidicola]
MRGIWEEFRAALCIIPGGSHRTPPIPPSPGRAADAEGEEEEGEDLLSALPDDVLLLVLLRLPSAAAAARTSVLSRRWCGLWVRLPELRFPHPADPLALARSRAALAAHVGGALPLLRVVAYDADPGDAAAVLRVAAPRLTGELFFRNVVPECRKKVVVARAGASAAIELPCFDKAERLLLRLGYLRLAMPPFGVFAKLTVLRLSNVRFENAYNFGREFSSARCPLLQELALHDTQGVSNLAICSESLIRMALHQLEGLQKLTIEAPMLRKLSVFFCFATRQPVAYISAPILEQLCWADAYDPRSVQLGELVQLQKLMTAACFTGYGFFEYMKNRGTVLLLQHFQKIDVLTVVIYPTNMVNYQYLMEAATLPPDIENLHLCLLTCGHAIGACVFYVLEISTSIRRLNLDIREGSIEDHSVCSSGCICHQPHDWETKELIFNSLQELNICGLSSPDCNFAFVKRLLGWTPVVKTITIKFDPSATVDELLCKELLNLSGPETCMNIYLYRNGAKVIYTPLD